MTGERTPEEPREAASEQPDQHAVWSVNREWSGRFLLLFAALTAGSVGWVFVATGSALDTVAVAGSCVVASAAAAMLMIEGGGRIMVSAAERWRRFREEPSRLRVQLTEEVRAEVTAEVTEAVKAQVTEAVKAQVTEAVTAEVTEALKAELNAEWEAWLARKQAAEAAGEVFDEPTPSAARNGDA